MRHKRFDMATSLADFLPGIVRMISVERFQVKGALLN
jgi:hypothetical protein